MTITLGELILSVLLSLGIGLILGTERGYTQACDHATALAKSHASGETLVQVPYPDSVKGAIYGSSWVAQKLCEGR
jgi:hypothetical protein